MNPAEIRIGNLLRAIKEGGYNNVGDIISVFSINREGINHWKDMGASGHLPFDAIEGVVLHENHLLYFGFKKISENHFVLNNNCSVFYESSGSEKGFWLNNNRSGANCYRIKKIDYVHTLQNACYELIETELIFKIYKL